MYSGMFHAKTALAVSVVGLCASFGTATAATYAEYDATITQIDATNLAPAQGGGLFGGEINNVIFGNPSVQFIGQAPTYDFIAWCLQPTEFLSNKETWTLVDLEDAPIIAPGTTMGSSSLNNANAMRYLFGTLNDDLDATISNAYDKSGLTLSAEERQSAFQLAIWELSQERTDAWDVATGSFARTSGDADVIAQANYWLGLIGTAGWVMDMNLYALIDEKEQDYIVKFVGPEGSLTPVPLPAAGWLFGSAILGTLMIGRRRLKKGAVSLPA